MKQWRQTRVLGIELKIDSQARLHPPSQLARHARRLKVIHVAEFLAIIHVGTVGYRCQPYFVTQCVLWTLQWMPTGCSVSKEAHWLYLVNTTPSDAGRENVVAHVI